MKWFKHMTGTVEDEKIAHLLDISGLEGYGFFWRIIEIVAAQIEKDSDKFQVKYSQNRLGFLTFSHGNKVRKLLGNLQETSLIALEISEEKGQIFYTISCPNILKYRDEWTSRGSKTRELIGRKSGETPEEIQIQIQNKKQIQKQIQTQKNEYTEEFDSFWSVYPRKEGKTHAFKLWKTRLKDGGTPAGIILAAKKYAYTCKKENKEPQFIKLPSTFLGPDWIEWRDKVIVKDPPMLPGQIKLAY